MGTEEGAADVGYLWGGCVRYVYILRQNDTLASLANNRLSSMSYPNQCMYYHLFAWSTLRATFARLVSFSTLNDGSSHPAS